MLLEEGVKVPCEINVLVSDDNGIRAINNATRNIDKNIKIAVMGCVVNGPGEASAADIGIAGGKGCGVLFKKGEIVRKINEKSIVDELIKEINKTVTSSKTIRRIRLRDKEFEKTTSKKISNGFGTELESGTPREIPDTVKTKKALAYNQNQLAVERTEFSKFRTDLAFTNSKLAVEQTHLAYLRTIVSLIGSGATIFKALPLLGISQSFTN